MDLERFISSGLVYSALESNVITLEDLLKYLQEKPVTDDTLVAYRHALLIIPGDLHYCQGSHFLCKAALEYGAIYTMSNAPELIKTTPDGQKIEAGVFSYKGILLMNQKPNFSRKVKIITDQSLRITLNDLSLIIKSRSEKLLHIIVNNFKQILFKNFLDVDWFSKIEKYYHPELIDHILTICQQRNNDLPEYWNKISSRYEQLLHKFFNRDEILPRKDLPKRIISLFPNFFPAITNNFSSRAWFIYQLPIYLQGYILGYPIHKRTPSREELNYALEQLSIIGHEKYAENYENIQRKEYSESCKVGFGFPSLTLSTVNETDTLEETIFSYPSFDIIMVDNEGKRYFFTRPEFNNLLKTSRNYWTNTPLSVEDIVLISSRNSTAEHYQLPKSIPMKDLLEKIETYTPKFYNKNRIYLQDPEEDFEENISDKITNEELFMSFIPEILSDFLQSTN